MCEFTVGMKTPSVPYVNSHYEMRMGPAGRSPDVCIHSRDEDEVIFICEFTVCKAGLHPGRNISV